jgi:hypothetical protein
MALGLAGASSNTRKPIEGIFCACATRSSLRARSSIGVGILPARCCYGYRSCCWLGWPHFPKKVRGPWHKRAYFYMLASFGNAFLRKMQNAPGHRENVPGQFRPTPGATTRKNFFWAHKHGFHGPVLHAKRKPSQKQKILTFLG